MTEQRNPSLAAKSSSRLAAAQLLYRIAVTGDKLDPEKLTRDYQAYLQDNAADPKEASLPKISPNPAFLKKLLYGIADHRTALETTLDTHLSTNWTRERMSPLLIAILLLAIYEMDSNRKLAAGILIDEYTSLAHRFFADDESSFVNALLNTIAGDMRSHG